jgi:fibronectin type 3 domain-containing protein
MVQGEYNQHQGEEAVRYCNFIKYHLRIMRMTGRSNMICKSKNLLSALAISASVLLPGERLAAEFVFLKDGRIITCKILNETPSTMTVLETGGKTIIVSRKSIVRVLYTQLYRGKLYIQKIDGSVIEAYIIDEDQEHYILRSDLNSPKEFMMKRDEVLFMTRKNPSALQGKVALKYADLSWRPPYTPDNPAKFFKIYLKTKGGDYKTAGETSDKSFRARGLLCNTEYHSIVTAVDKKDHESLPSNEVHFTTKKGRPSPPEHARAAGVTSNANRVCTVHVVWDRAVDPCGGTITEYGVYLKDDEEKRDDAAAGSSAKFPGYRLAGRTSATEYRIPGLKDRRRYRIKVTSIDNTRDESDMGRTLVVKTKNKLPGYPFPVTCRKIVSSDKNAMTAKLSWKQADDPDGNETGYRVYKKGDNTYDLIGSTDKTEYEIKGLAPSAKHYFVVRTVDNRGDESAESYPAATGLVRYASLTGRGAYLLPTGNYRKIYKQGYGGSLFVSVENLFLEGMALGGETGYFHLEGNADRSQDGRLVPFMLTASFRLPLARWVSIDPHAAFGGCYNIARVNSLGIVSPELFFLKRYADRNAVEIMFSAGLQVTFNIKKLALIQLEASYSGIVELGIIMGFFTFSGGAGVRF